MNKLEWPIVMQKFVTAETNLLLYLPLILTTLFMGGHMMQLHAWTENSPGQILLCMRVDRNYHL